MCILNDCNKNPVARDFFIDKVKDVVIDGACNLDDLCDAEKREVTGFLIQALDEPYEWFFESDKRAETLEKLINVMAYSHIPDVNKEDLTESIQDQAVEYYSRRLNEYIVKISECYVEE